MTDVEDLGAGDSSYIANFLDEPTGVFEALVKEVNYIPREQPPSPSLSGSYFSAETSSSLRMWKRVVIRWHVLPHTLLPHH